MVHVENVNTVKSVKSNSPGKVKIQMNGIEVNAIIDTGSSVNIIDENTYKLIGSPSLFATESSLFPFGVNEKLNVEGKFVANISAKEKEVRSHVHVIKGSRVCNVLSEKASLELGLIKYVHKIELNPESDCPELFEGFGKLSDYELKLHVDESVKPVVQTSRKVPFAHREKVEIKLKEL